ncbi:MAG: hypothetical protein NXH81_15855 [Halieaceae bacterium]|jgi:lipid-binding SYLF domain-containing protein|uniref:lipid-binding SYLF domain-containing protein n=1 Tax=Haliea alexandrii TaxID=2448162 RepID=UPI000F0BBD89|nr:hypothetical protein [Haliea alexandrii]MCR9186874.1 hypothetical protein [Halieaceae bacterium]
MTTLMQRSAVAVMALLLGLATVPAGADTRESIEVKSDAALDDLRRYSPGVNALLTKARGVLVFPDIVNMGFGVGGQYGEGTLLVDGEPVAYYASSAGPAELPPGATRAAKVILFMTTDALVSFRNTVGWEVGLHGEVDLVQTAGGNVRLARAKHPVLALSFSDKGIIEGADLNGSTINRIAR